MDAKALYAKGHLFRLDNGKFREASSRRGIFHFELPSELERTFSSTGKVITQKVVNLCCCRYEDAVERAKALVAVRIREAQTMDAAAKPTGDLIEDSLRKDNPQLGLPTAVWGKYANCMTGKANEGELKSDHAVFEDFVSWFGERSLYEMDDDTANKYITHLGKTLTGNKIWHDVLPVLHDIWLAALPLCKNPWAGFKHDPMRDAVVPKTPAGVDDSWLDKSVDRFVNEYFKQEAASGRKWEHNVAGFVSHLKKHTGVVKVRDVTETVAMKYAQKMHDGDGTKVARSGADRISKFRTIWNTMLPNHPNPWKNVNYESLDEVKRYNELLREVAKGNLMSPSHCLRCTNPETLWVQFTQKHPIKKKRAGTVKAIFLRMWKKTGIHSLSELTSAVARQYMMEVMRDKKSGDQDIDELGLIWWNLVPGTKNPWKLPGDHFVPYNINKTTDQPPKKRVIARPPVECKPEVNPQEALLSKIAIAEDKEKKGESFGKVVDCIKELSDLELTPTADQIHYGAIPPAIPTPTDMMVENPHDIAYQKPLSFEEAYDVWAKEHEGRYKPNTYVAYKHKLDLFADWCRKGDPSLVPEQIDVETARKFIESLLWAGKTSLVNYISPLNMIWDTALPNIQNPWRKVYEEVVLHKGIDAQPKPPVKVVVDKPKTDEPKPQEATAKPKRKARRSLIRRLFGWLFGFFKKP